MTQEATPKKKMPIITKAFIVIAAILALLGIDHITFNIAKIGASVTVTGSALVVTPIVDTTKNIALDTAKKSVAKADTAKKPK